MPISNPIIQGLTVNVIQGSEVTIANSNPTATPTTPKNFWFNVITNRIYLAIATNSPSDWRAIASDSSGEIDAASILNKILVQDGQVLTTDDHVIFED